MFKAKPQTNAKSVLPRRHWVILSYQIIDEVKSHNPLKKIMGDFDAMHIGSHLIVCRIRHMLYDSKDVFLLPHNFNSKEQAFTNAVKFRNELASDLFQYEMFQCLPLYFKEKNLQMPMLRMPLKITVSGNKYNAKKKSKRP